MLRKIAIALLGLMIFAGVSAINAAETGSDTKNSVSKISEVSKRPTFSFTDTAGSKIEIVETRDGLSFPTLKNKNVIVLFYLYSGTPCRNELKLFSAFREKSENIEFVTFELKGLKKDQLKDFEKELGISGLHMIDMTQAMPFVEYIARRIGWRGSVPLIIAVDGKGSAKLTQLGALSGEELENLAKKLGK
jgi:hypothetical protein